MLRPETIEQIEALATEMGGMFLPPELIVGCEVLSVADKDQYAANNGWIEARVGRHNQQRCRWRGQFVNVQVGDFVDVLFFTSYRLFVVFGKGGAGVIVPPGGGWPFSLERTVDPTDTDADDSTITDGITNAAAGNLVVAGVSSYNEAVEVSKNITVKGRNRRRTLILQSVLMSASSGELEDVYVYVDGSGTYGLGINATVTVTNCNAEHWNVANAKAVQVIGGTGLLRNVYARSSGSTTSRALEVANGAVCTVDESCEFNSLGAGTNFDVYVDTGGSCVLNGPILNSGTIGGGGTVTGWYRDGDGNVHFVNTTGMSGGVWRLRADNLRVKEADFATANTNASAGDTILLYPGTYTANDVTITNGVNVKFVDPENTLLTTATGQYCIRTGANTYLLNVRASNTASNASFVAAIFMAGNNSIAENCVGIGSNSHASGFGYGFYQTGATGVELRHCYGDGTGTTAADNYGYRKDTTAGGTCKITSGQYLGDANSLYNDQTGDVSVGGAYLPTFVKANDGGGVFAGYYLDANYDLRLIGDWQLFKPNYPTNDVWRVDAASNSDFVATIATLPGGAVLTYNAPSSGDENNLVPASTSHIAKMVLHNTTRGTEALISNCVAGTNTITLTANVPAGWQVGDTITIRSQTNTTAVAAGVYYADIEFISDLDTLAKSVILSVALRDSGAASRYVIFHPYEADAPSKRRVSRSEVANVFIDWTSPPISVISNRFCLAWSPSGTGTMVIIVNLSAEGAAYS